MSEPKGRDAEMISELVEVVRLSINAALEEAANAVFHEGGIWYDTDRILSNAADRVRALKRPEPRP